MKANPLVSITLLLGWLMLSLPAAWALSLDTPLADTAQEARAKALFQEIRCAVCQSESIADSPADVAFDMRRLIRQKIMAGDSDSDIRGFLVARYGGFILMKPPLNRSTLLLWLGPLIVFGIAAWLARLAFRTRPRRPKEEEDLA